MLLQKITAFGIKILKRIRLHRRHLMLLVGALLLLIVIWALFKPQTIVYDFGQKQTCQISPRIFPQLSKIEQKYPFKVQRPVSVSIGRFALYSGKLCVIAHAVPAAKATVAYRERLFGWSIFGHNVHVDVPAYPQFINQFNERRLLSPEGILALTLDKPDKTFTYSVKANERSADCSLEGRKIACSLSSLQLNYAQQYEVVLLRQFSKKHVSKMAAAPIQTLTPLAITSTSILAHARVEQKPKELIIQADKEISSLGEVVLVAKNANGSETPIPVTATTTEKTITVTFNQELARKVNFEMRLNSVKAVDGSGLTGKSFMLPFSTSGGPKVTGANIGTRSVPQGHSIVLTFDQELATDQNVASQINFSIQGKVYPADVTAAGNKVHIKPHGGLPLCAAFSVKLGSEVRSRYGIAGDSAWQINSRAVCYTTFNIGASVKGRAITAYKFGVGDNPIVYMGAMHGDEINSKNLMTEWFNELNANPGRLSGRSLVVIPAVNPDGVAARSRLNARSIDLNRNFPASDWKTMVTSPESPTPTPAGGPNPLSEPESFAIATYIRQTRPRAVFSFHSSAAVVEANEAADSVAMALAYATRSRYRAVPKSQSASVFKYDTTGAMEDWMRSSLGLPAVVVELLSDTSSEFSRNRDALWHTTSL